MAAVSPAQAAPPTPQEVSRKLSISQKTPRPRKKPTINISTSNPLSGTESDSDSHSQIQLSPDASSLFFPSTTVTPGSQPPLSVIAEADALRNENESDGDEDEDDPEGEGLGWRSVDAPQSGEAVVKAGYLWKKGVRRKAWKKRWFVLRPTHLAYYKDESEYKLLRLLDLSEIHAITPCSLKRHTYTFGLVSPSRTFYLQAASQRELEDWVTLTRECREGVVGVETVRGDEGGTATPPIPIPTAQGSRSGGSSYGGPGSSPLSSRRSQSPARYFTSSEEEDFVAGAGQQQQGRSVSTTASGMPMPANAPTSSTPLSPSGATPLSATKITQGSSQQAQLPNQVTKEKDPSKPVISGYLMKCSSKSSAKRRSWKKRWFVLTGQRLYYSGSHMDTKPHRNISLDHILDALEDDSTTVGSSVGSPTHGHGHGHGHGVGHSMSGAGDDTATGEGSQGCVFKIVTTKRTLVLSAPSEAEEIKWLSTVRALIARRSGPGPGHGPSVHGSKGGGHSRNESSGH